MGVSTVVGNTRIDDLHCQFYALEHSLVLLEYFATWVLGYVLSAGGVRRLDRLLDGLVAAPWNVATVCARLLRAVYRVG